MLSPASSGSPAGAQEQPQCCKARTPWQNSARQSLPLCLWAAWNAPVDPNKTVPSLSQEGIWHPEFGIFIHEPSPHPAAVTHVYSHTLSCCSLIKQSCSDLLGMCMVGIFFFQSTLGAPFISLSFEMTIFLSNLPNCDTFSDDILCTKADLLHLLAGNVGGKKLSKLTFLPPFSSTNLLWSAVPCSPPNCPPKGVICKSGYWNPHKYSASINVLLQDI